MVKVDWRLKNDPLVVTLSSSQLIRFLEGKYICVSCQWGRVISGQVMVIDPVTNRPKVLSLKNYQTFQLRAWAATAMPFIHPN